MLNFSQRKPQMSESSGSDEKAKAFVYRKMQMAAALSLLVFGIGLIAFSSFLGTQSDSLSTQSTRSRDLEKWPTSFSVQPRAQGLTLMSFWAHWCQPCLSEMPDMVQLSKGLEDFAILFINADDKESDSLQQAKSFSKPLESENVIFEWRDGKQLMSQIGLLALPAHFLLNSEGQVLWHAVGGIHWLDSEVKDQIQKFQRLEAKNGSGAN